MKFFIGDGGQPFGFGFEGWKDPKDWKPREIKPCTHPDGHLWEEESTVLLSYPPQYPLTCVRCGETTMRTESVPKPKRYTDEELKRIKGLK